MIVLFVSCIQISPHIYGQQESKHSIDRKHLIATAVAFTPSRIMNESKTMYYAHGSLIFYTTPRLSVRGDGSFSFREYQGDAIAIRYHSTFLGLCYHFTKNGAFDPFIGIQPGISFFERSVFNGIPVDKTKEILPNASVVVGLNFFVNHFFNLFGNVRYVYGQPATNPTIGTGLHEIRLAFGLGINLVQSR